ncbi:MAG: diadenylate cyclase CdaA [Bacteroidales bacterium]|nr:diadenylate cyclase CdaA [Bacteroidales bacterium]
MILGVFEFLNISFADFLDIILVAIIIFLLFKWIRGSSAVNILLAVVVLLVVRVIVEALNMRLMSGLMGALVDIGILALIVLFQPEIRHSLLKFTEKSGFARSTRKVVDRLFGIKEQELADTSVREIAEACEEMSALKEGALIVLTRKDNLDYIVQTGDRVDAQISKRLILNIFFKNSPLHDGAMVIGSDRIIAARCTLPISDNSDIPAHYGMRHKAAIGITEECDAHVLVVSEETGTISYVSSGEIRTVNNVNELFALLGPISKAGASQDKTA